jgi:hypothetical protein
VAGRYDIDCEKGATFRRVVQWSDGSGSPVNLTGYTARMQVRESFASTSTVASLTTSNGGITLAHSTGGITLYLSAIQTAALSTSAAFADTWEGVYDLELVAGNGDVTRLLSGAFLVVPEVTR